MSHKVIGILGGSGFVGQHLAAMLSSRGYQVRMLVRHPADCRELTLIPAVQLIRGDCFNKYDLVSFCGGIDALINLVGILNEKRDNGQGFDHAHVELAHRIVQACQVCGPSRILQMSALNASKDGSSYYLRSKGEAEDWLHQASNSGLLVTSFRPSVIFGPRDSFFRRFLALLKWTPAVFPLACAKSRFAPVFVGDVCRAFLRGLEDPATIGRRYDLCGPHSYTLKQLVEYTARVAGLKRIVIGLPDPLARLQAMVLGHMPGKPFTMDNYRSLQTDSVCIDNGLLELDIQPQSLETIVPACLPDNNRRGRLNRYRRQRPFVHGRIDH